MLCYDTAKKIYDTLMSKAAERTEEDFQESFWNFITAFPVMSIDTRIDDKIYNKMKTRHEYSDNLSSGITERVTASFADYLRMFCRKLHILDVLDIIQHQDDYGDLACYFALFLALDNRQY